MEYELSYVKLKRYLSSFDVVSFSLWNTLIARSVLNEQDVFSIAGIRAGMTDRSFSADRIRAEKIADARFGKGAAMARIYQVLAEFQYSKDLLQILKEAEIQTEIDVAVPRIPVVQLLKELLHLGKRVLICCDSCLSKEQICKILDKCGIPSSVEIYLSSETNADTESEAFWEQILTAHGPFVHLGSDPKAEQHPLIRLGQKVVWIQNGMRAFAESSMAPYLSPFFCDDLACSLFMGYFIQKACFNSPFSDYRQKESATGIWMGAALTCFVDYLVSHRDDSLLLFVTREGYLLHPLYVRYCAALGVKAQESVLFYASRSATLAAMAVTKSALRDVLRFSYNGTLGHMLKNRLNFDLPQEDPLYDERISLPKDAGRVEKLLSPYLSELFANSKKQQDAYKQYIQQVNPSGKPMTVVDVGYSGTIQYALARITEGTLGGHYMYLTEKALPETVGCPIDSLRNAWDGNYPIYDNLLFLEAAMQVPFGQLKQMCLEEGTIVPIFNQDANMSEYIPIAQEQYIQFAEWAAGWKRVLGDSFCPDFALAEALWVVLLRFDGLSNMLLDGFWLADDFAGMPLWCYDAQAQIWIGQDQTIPLVFTLLKAGTKPSLKQQIKYYVKKYIPRSMYTWAQKFWSRYLR